MPFFYPSLTLNALGAAGGGGGEWYFLLITSEVANFNTNLKSCDFLTFNAKLDSSLKFSKFAISVT